MPLLIGRHIIADGDVGSVQQVRHGVNPVIVDAPRLVGAARRPHLDRGVPMTKTDGHDSALVTGQHQSVLDREIWPPAIEDARV